MEQVILVDDHNNQIGVADKETVHTTHTPLHRAFSLFIFNSRKQLLVTQRALDKKTFPGIWTNSVCGHVSPGEDTISSVRRRVQYELGFLPKGIQEVAFYRYQFSDINGIMENEICPIYIAFSDENPLSNPKELHDWKWIDWANFLTVIKQRPGTYSPWSEEEAFILQQLNLVPLQ